MISRFSPDSRTSIFLPIRPGRPGELPGAVGLQFLIVFCRVNFSLLENEPGNLFGFDSQKSMSCEESSRRRRRAARTEGLWRHQ